MRAAQQQAKPAAGGPRRLRRRRRSPLPTLDPPAYVYEPGRPARSVHQPDRARDRRDPTGARPPGLSGLLIGEVTVKGVSRPHGFIAMLQAPDNKTYTVRVGDKLLDGTVKSINQETVIFSQDVNDPLSLVKQREVPKPVRQADGRGGSTRS